VRIALYLDEDVAVQLARALQQRGIDVRTTQNAGMAQSSDEQQVAFAAEQRRAILTHNKRDFILIHQKYLEQGDKHSGIIVADQDKLGSLVRRVSKLWFSVSAEKMKNRLEFLGSWQ
jgi:predicted nuclease of predicted toxin-antitoxin system